MKRIIVLGIMVALTIGLHAQSDSSTDAIGDTTAQNQKFKIQLGLSGGATLFAAGSDDHSPYYSKYGFMLQIPLMARWQMAPHWSLSAGLRYDFCWTPLRYAVEPASATDQDLYQHGLQINQTPTTGTQRAHAYHSYVGIPIELKWYPRADQHGLFAVGLDFFAGYAVSQYFNIDNITRGSNGNWYLDGYNRDTFNAMIPWKMELGLSFNTDVLGLVHGVRFFTNLLPTYKDPDTGAKIYMTGMTVFL